MTGRTGTWPEVLGWVAIGLGGAGLGCFGCGGLGLLVLLATDLTDVPTVALPPAPWFTVVQNLTTAALSGLLLAAGLRLRARRRSARRLALLWAWLRIGTSGAGTIGSLIVGTDPAAVSILGISRPGLIAFQLVTSVFGLAWAFALPLIMIIWFARPAIRQQVAGWPVERLKPPSAKKDGPAPPKRVRERRELPPRGFDQWS